MKAAQYLRVSSEAQHQSLQLQAVEIAAYAAVHGHEIVKTYTDDGRSGLRLKGRPALQQLLADVVQGATGYDIILVQDVSRWGRFQDGDEAAHYEYICRAAGVDIRYCNDSLENGAKAADVFKAMKRLMAADFSRQLSQKIRGRQLRLAADGFKMGGRAGYGLRRAAVEADGTLSVLAPGERRNRGQRLVLVRGPPEEVATVRRIFKRYLQDNTPIKEIARLLNAEGIAWEPGHPWNDRIVAMLLNNPKYGGDYIFGRYERHLSGGRSKRARTEWLCARDAVEAIVPRAWVRKAQRLRRLKHHMNDAELWRSAKDHLRKTGDFSRSIANEARDLPSALTYHRRFGPWNRILAKLGHYPPPHLSSPQRELQLVDYPRSAAGGQSPERPQPTTCTAFDGDTRVASGSLAEVIATIKRMRSTNFGLVLVIDDRTGRVHDVAFDLSIARATAQLEKDERLNQFIDVDPRLPAFRVMYAFAGHRPGYGATLKALYVGDSDGIAVHTAAWPSDVRAYIATFTVQALSALSSI